MIKYLLIFGKKFLWKPQKESTKITALKKQYIFKVLLLSLFKLEYKMCMYCYVSLGNESLFAWLHLFCIDNNSNRFTVALTYVATGV